MHTKERERKCHRAVFEAYRVPQPCNLDGISMNIQEENSARYFRVQSEREQTLVTNFLEICALIILLCGLK